MKTPKFTNSFGEIFVFTKYNYTTKYAMKRTISAVKATQTMSTKTKIAAKGTGITTLSRI
jgi:hypothetical protein